MVSHQKKSAWMEAISDTAIGTLINFPLNILLLSIAAWANFTLLETSVFLSVVFIILAVIRKYLVRCYFTKKDNDVHEFHINNT